MALDTLDDDDYSFTDEGEEYHYDWDYISEVMDYITSDETGKTYYQNKHTEIINEHLNGEDWDWKQVIDYWDVDDVIDAIDFYEEHQCEDKNPQDIQKRNYEYLL